MSARPAKRSPPPGQNLQNLKKLRENVESNRREVEAVLAELKAWEAGAQGRLRAAKKKIRFAPGTKMHDGTLRGGGPGNYTRQENGLPVRSPPQAWRKQPQGAFGKSIAKGFASNLTSHPLNSITNVNMTWLTNRDLPEPNLSPQKRRADNVKKMSTAISSRSNSIKRDIEMMEGLRRELRNLARHLPAPAAKTIANENLGWLARQELPELEMFAANAMHDKMLVLRRSMARLQANDGGRVSPSKTSPAKASKKPPLPQTSNSRAARTVNSNGSSGSGSNSNNNMSRYYNAVNNQGEQKVNSNTYWNARNKQHN